MRSLRFFTLLLLLLITACSSPATAIAPSPSFHTAALTPFAVLPTATVISATPTAILPTASATYSTALFEKGPYLVSGNDPAQMKILWQDPSTTSSVEWGTDTSFSGGKIQATLLAENGLQQAILTGLPPASTIQYRVISGDAAAAGSFRTPPESTSTTPLTLWVYGDTRSGPEIQNAIAHQILADIQQHPEDQTMVLFTGDIMDTADESNLEVNLFDPQWQGLHQLLSEVPLITARGNHDGTALMNQYFPYPFAGEYYWSLDYGLVHIAVVDQFANLSPYSPQFQWLKNDLASSSLPWKIILLHMPGWSGGPHENDLIVQKWIHPLAYHNGVSLVLAGHNHYYARARVDGIEYITTGGGGAPLYDPVCNMPNMLICKKDYHYLKMIFSSSSVSVTALTPEGEILDEFTIEK